MRPPRKAHSTAIFASSARPSRWATRVTDPKGPSAGLVQLVQPRLEGVPARADLAVPAGDPGVPAVHLLAVERPEDREEHDVRVHGRQQRRQVLRVEGAVEAPEGPEVADHIVKIGPEALAGVRIV